MKKIACLLPLFLIIFSATLKAQDKKPGTIWNSPFAYLGQQPPGDTPIVFAQELLVDSGIVLGRVAFSKDGRSFYYAFARHWFDYRGTGVKQIRFDGKQWNKPAVIGTDIGCPTLSVDEKSLYFGGKGSTVWKSDKINGNWTTPTLWLQQPFGLYNFMPTRSGTYYVGSNGTGGDKKDYSSYDFCALTMKGGDTVIKSLGTPLNTTGFNGDFFIAPDESYIIVSAKETPTYECELWISFRKKDKTWTEPVSLGDKINQGSAHRFGQYVSPDGKFLFYTKGTSENDCHFYWVRFDTLLKQLRPKA
ncbi:MAG: hypothetical protein QM726_10210 [Chitinophagaceae bacterium]